MLAEACQKPHRRLTEPAFGKSVARFRLRLVHPRYCHQLTFLDFSFLSRFHMSLGVDPRSSSNLPNTSGRGSRSSERGAGSRCVLSDDVACLEDCDCFSSFLRRAFSPLFLSFFFARLRFPMMLSFSLGLLQEHHRGHEGSRNRSAGIDFVSSYAHALLVHEVMPL